MIPQPSPEPGPMSHHARRLDRAVREICRHLVPDAGPGGVAAAPAILPGPSDADAPTDDAALDILVATFSLTPFEASVLVLAAAAEISADAARLCAAAAGDPAAPYPTPALALTALPAAELGAFAPDAALRHWRLVTVDRASPDGLLQARLRVPEPVLCFLIGRPMLDDQLAALLDIVAPGPLLATEQELAHRLATALASDAAPVVHVVAKPSRRMLDIAAAAARILGTTLYHLPHDQLPTGASASLLSRLWQRDQVFVQGTLAISIGDGQASAGAARFAAEADGPVIVIGDSPDDLEDHGRRPVIRFHPAEASDTEIRTCWRSLLGLDPRRPAPKADALAARFRLPLSAIAGCIAVAAAGTSGATPPAPDAVLDRLAPLLREQARHRLSGLAHRVPPRATIQDLVLPDTTKGVLDQIIGHYRNSFRVLGDWGFAKGGNRSLGVLFAGPSGTGKTMAAEVIAGALELDLFRVDLSRIVDKYIGETEKNLARVFDAADSFDAILLFDEADALFGRRGEVRDSRDRHANLQIGYLLQRMESYRGVAILTSNLPGAMDPAFSRRLAYIVHFTLPDSRQRREIWQRSIPARTPTGQLDLDRLARLSLSGGQIRTVALNAAMIAADREEPLSMQHIAVAVGTEFAKLQRAVPAAELADWPT